jgi:hypothetical protein
MTENNNKNMLKKLLDRLQEDSWQLELLVSGFTIFGLFYALGPVGDALDKASYEHDILREFYYIIYGAIFILILNLVIHVVLRSLWIGALGLRYLSGEVDIEKLNYGKQFTNYLKKKVGFFDDYIEKLEKLCSIIFAVSFLLIFYVAAVFIVQYLINFIGSFFSDDSSKLLRGLLNTTIILILFGAVLTFIDYLTQGLLKKNKWIAKLYFPFYWVFSILTLSFLYRPLYYNLIDNKFGRRVSFMLLPFYISVLLIASIYKEQSGFINYYSVITQSNTILANSRNYEDIVEKDDLFINVLCIQSKIITDPYIKVKIPLSRGIENNLMDFNESLRSCQDKNRYKFAGDINGMTIKSTFKGNNDSLHVEFLKTYQKTYGIKIDSVPYKPEFVIVNDGLGKNLEISFETYIGTGNLEEGKHVLVYYRPKHPETDSIITIKEIPFWYYKK